MRLLSERQDVRYHMRAHPWAPHFANLSADANEACLLGQEEAQRNRCYYVGSEYLVLGIIALNKGVAAKAMKSANVTLEDARAALIKEIGVGHGYPIYQMQYTNIVLDSLKNAKEWATEFGTNFCLGQGFLNTR
jgi:ATP-dependent Clp protease ATP-binding subunit ClpC